MNKETELRIEKEAETRYFSLDEVLAFKCGAESEHPKAWNAAIGEALSETWKLFDTSEDESKPIIHQVTKILEALKLDPNQA